MYIHCNNDKGKSYFFGDPLPEFFFLFIAWYSTARGFECGAALTFVCPTDEDRLAQVEERLRGDGGEKIIILYMRVSTSVLE